MHTTVSDGSDTPEQIVARVKEAGISVFSVTDHDAVKAGRIIPPLLSEGDPAFVTGAEFSCRDKFGKYHILGYGYDPDSNTMRELVETGHRYRVNKVRARLDYLKETFGFAFPEEEIRKLFSLDNPGKPHIANMMVRFGFAEDKEQAIKKYINGIHFRNEYVRPQEAIRSILESGGIPVLAHPSYGDGDQLILGDEMKDRLVRLTALGLQGVEAFYSGFTPRMTKEMLSFADSFGLYVTAGSDYHGSNKMISLGDTGLDDTTEFPAGLERFLKDVHRAKVS